MFRTLQSRWRCRPSLVGAMFLSGSMAMAVFALTTATGVCAPAKKPPPPDEIGDRVYIYEDDGSPGKFIPSGWMPDGDGITQNTSETDTPHSGKHCLRLHCQLSKKPWVGIYFLLKGEWEPDETFNLFEKLDARQGDPIKCRFWARTADKMSVQFKVGGVRKGKVRDSLVFPAATRHTKLTPEWKMYEIDLTGKDLSSLVGGFVWVCDDAHNGGKDVSFDLDTIYFVKTKPKKKPAE